MKTFIIFVLIFLFIHVYKINNQEHFGALTQLYAKGPQDSYLTVGTDRYVPEYWGYYGPPWYQRHMFVWNQPTRISPNYYPLYGVFPNPYYYNPYQVYY